LNCNSLNRLLFLSFDFAGLETVFSITYFCIARNNRLEFVTVEHLLSALLNIGEVVSFLRHKRVNIKEVYAELEEYIDSHTPLIPNELFLPFFGLDFTVDTSSSNSGERVEIASMTSRREMLLSFNK
jgi:ATP-dependent Clp protease ATP-binding subunit ClpA